MKIKNYLLILPFLILLGSIYLFFNRSVGNFQISPEQNIQYKDNEKINILVGENILQVEVVSSSQGLSQGLSERESLDTDGMLFIMPKKQVANFWMKDMKFDLDFIFIGEGAVLEVIPDVSSKKDASGQVRSVVSQFPVDYVLEMKAGSVQKFGIEQGDQFSLVDSDQ